MSLAPAGFALCCVVAAAAPEPVETVVVTGRRVATPSSASASAITTIGRDTMALGAPVHLNEIGWRAPGAWISRGSGQEHLTAIRSPVLTGAGSCGAFLFLEDSIPVRPAGFCNVNQLFEINTGQAHAIEIARGPLSAVWGANALHGAINVVQDAPRDAYLAAALGPDDYQDLRVALNLPKSGLLLAAAAHDGGFRADSGYDQGKLNLLLGDKSRLRLHLAAVKLQQETAGFVLGTDAYRDDSLRESNPNPEAYRDVEALRASLHFSPIEDFDARLYARHSEMSFLQHFLPGQPVERNAQQSIGAQLQKAFSSRGFDTVGGVDIEYAGGELEQSQAGPTSGSDFLRATRPAGRHYDYRVDASMLALWISTTRALSPLLDLEMAARAEYLGYDYDNRLADGNLRDDGSACGFGGCLYNRPADRRDHFVDVAPRIALLRALPGEAVLRLQLARGFRPPQATELYRLQRGQDVADLDSERIDSIETGVRARYRELELDVTLFHMDKRNVVLRDADGFNVSAGRTRHSGVELDLALQATAGLGLELTATLARHRYAFDRLAAQGETIRDGNDIDTAPGVLASARANWRPRDDLRIELEALHMGDYYTDAANTRRYPGHTLLNLRLRQQIGTRWSVGLRVANLGDRRYAERADFAFGSDRYFPGRERAVFVDLTRLLQDRAR